MRRKTKIVQYSPCAACGSACGLGCACAREYQGVAPQTLTHSRDVPAVSAQVAAVVAAAAGAAETAGAGSAVPVTVSQPNNSPQALVPPQR